MQLDGFALRDGYSTICVARNHFWDTSEIHILRIRKHDIPKARAVKILTPAVTHVSWDDDKGPCGANFSKTPAFDVPVMRMGSVDW